MVRHPYRIAPAIALTLALAAAAPAAARPELSAPSSAPQSAAPASSNLCSEVCSSSGYTTNLSSTPSSAERGATLAHDPRARAVALAADVSRSSGGPRSEVVSGAGYSAPAAVTVVHVTRPGSSGFDWGDAGIGAGGALALMMLFAGGAMATISSRRRSGGRAAQPTT